MKLWKHSTDCCLWDGITCDESTGHVIGLDLGDSSLTGTIGSNSSLFHLVHLQKLDLSFNYFDDSEISFKFGQLNSLTHLDLSHLGFNRRIPVEFYHLSNLEYLDLSSSFPFSFWSATPHPYVNIGMLLGNTTNLRVLMLFEVDIPSKMPANMSSFLTELDLSHTGVYGKLPPSIFEKPNLRILRLDGNELLTGSMPSQLNGSSVHSLTELELSDMSISGRLPQSIGFMANLNYMRLRDSKFSGPIPESIGNITGITEIDFSNNEFSGPVPPTISNLRHLRMLELSNNLRLQGKIPDAFSGLQKLTHLLLSDNNFTGPIPPSITNMSNLQSVDISSNALTGPITATTGIGLQKLSFIDLSNNSIHGMMPSWLPNLPSLNTLDLSSNRPTGKTGYFNCHGLESLYLDNNQLNIELQSFSNLTQVANLFISHNKLTNTASNAIVNVTLPNLVRFSSSSCEVIEFPALLRNSPRLQLLDLSNNTIHGPISSWFNSICWNDLLKLDLSTNYLTHSAYIPWQNLPSLNSLDLHSNSFWGTLPQSICNMSFLSILDLSDNRWTSKIPKCIGNLSYALWVLNLRTNTFHGKIPTTIGDGLLTFLGLNNNHLEGPLPRSLINSTSLEVLDLGNNIIQDTFPWWLESLPQLRILILNSNKFYGSIRAPVLNDSFSKLQTVDLSHNNFTGLLPEFFFASLQAMKNQDEDAISHDLYMGTDRYRYSVTLTVKGSNLEYTKVFKVLTTIDLSSNNFHGHIPESLAYMNSLLLLNLSHNSINGSIPPALGQLTKLEQLDLSSNQLTGGIPSTLTNLIFLSVLNLLHNHLVGRIPQGKQFAVFPNDSYTDNSGLCGFPLTKDCGNHKAPPPPAALEEDDDSSFMMGFTWKAVVIGYGSGIVVGFIIGNVMISTGKPQWLAI